MSSSPVRKVEIRPGIKVGDGEKLLLFAGPCQIESLDHSLMIAEKLQSICAKRPVNLVFKSSFDKANRTSLGGKRGLGPDEGLRILSAVREKTGLPVITDIHEIDQIARAAQAVDVLQIPAFLCRQTDLLVAAGRSGKAIHVKKGQFLHPSDMAHVAKKISSEGNHNVLLCERGACFGYRDLVVDMRSLVIMRSCGYPVVFDATHSVQSMGGAEGSGGSREHVPPLVRAAAAVGVDGLFLECHEAPERAPSDAASMLRIDSLPAVLESALRIRETLSDLAA